MLTFADDAAVRRKLAAVEPVGASAAAVRVLPGQLLVRGGRPRTGRGRRRGLEVAREAGRGPRTLFFQLCSFLSSLAFLLLLYHTKGFKLERGNLFKIRFQNMGLNNQFSKTRHKFKKTNLIVYFLWVTGFENLFRAVKISIKINGNVGMGE